MVKISIITVCYNAETHIEKTILSILNQTAAVYEYIIVDGGSTDETMRIVQSYTEQFESAGISYRFRSEKDKGISDAFNKGIHMATGDLIGLINADDELIQGTSEIVQKAYVKDVDVYYGNCVWVDKANKLSFISKPKVQNPAYLKSLLYEMVMIHPSTFITANAYEKAGVYDTSFRFCMDQELLYRMYCAGLKFHYIDKELTVFKAGGVSDTNPRKVFHEASRIPISAGEPIWKVKYIEAKKLCRNFLAQKAKRMGIYNIIKYRQGVDLK